METWCAPTGPAFGEDLDQPVSLYHLILEVDNTIDEIEALFAVLDALRSAVGEVDDAIVESDPFLAFLRSLPPLRDKSEVAEERAVPSYMRHTISSEAKRVQKTDVETGGVASQRDNPGVDAGALPRRAEAGERAVPSYARQTISSKGKRAKRMGRS
mmetsp:Transcript_41734/g.87580  ORF Transcript_41734/g.87580 Transcript_41734/m.87580 type:complete len:157 (-) Transcript_41734:160-630(-)